MSKLKEIRIKNKISQSKLSKESEVSIRMIQKYEQGVKDINKAQALSVYKLAIALRVKVDDLLELENEVDNNTK